MAITRTDARRRVVFEYAETGEFAGGYVEGITLLRDAETGEVVGRDPFKRGFGSGEDGLATAIGDHLATAHEECEQQRARADKAEGRLQALQVEIAKLGGIVGRTVALQQQERDGVVPKTLDDAKQAKFDEIAETLNTKLAAVSSPSQRDADTRRRLDLNQVVAEGGTLTSDEQAELDAINARDSVIAGLRAHADTLAAQIASQTDRASVEAFDVTAGWPA